MRKKIVAVVFAVLVLGAWNCTGTDPNIVVDCSLDEGPYASCPNLVQDEGQKTGTLTYDSMEGFHTVTIRARQLCGKEADGSLKFGPPGTASWSWDADPAEPNEFKFSVEPGHC